MALREFPLTGGRAADYLLFVDGQAVADGLNVDYDVFLTRTQISEVGSTVEAGLGVDKQDRASRAVW